MAARAARSLSLENLESRLNLSTLSTLIPATPAYVGAAATQDVATLTGRKYRVDSYSNGNAGATYGAAWTNLQYNQAQSFFNRFRHTLTELGRQLLASKAGMLRINCTTREEWMKNMDWGHHHLGTTRMHDDPRRGVVDANGRVHGLPNLFIAGSSVFPSYGASNPTMNLVALTLRLADHLKTVLA